MTKCFTTENVEILLSWTSNEPVTQVGSMKSVLEYLFVSVSHYLINLTQIFHNKVITIFFFLLSKVITNLSAFGNIKDKKSRVNLFS